MPGENCSVFGCGSCRRTKGIGIWKLPAAKNVAYKRWRADWLGEITKTREIDKAFKELIAKDRVYTCERYFAPEDIEIFTTDKMTKKKPRFGALPTLNMPIKSHESKKPPERPHRAVVKDSPQSGVYKSLQEVSRGLKDLKSLKNWSCKAIEDKVILKKIQNEFTLPQIEVIIDDSLGFTVKAFGCLLPDDHPVYLAYRRSIVNITMKNLVHELEEYKLCCGVTVNELNGKLFHYVIPMYHEENDGDEGNQFPHKGYWRIKGCSLLCDNEVCDSCDQFMSSVKIANQAKTRRLSTPAQVKAPVSKTDPARIKLTLQGQRLRCAELEQELNATHSELEKNNIEIDDELSNDLTDIMAKAGSKVTPFMNLFIFTLLSIVFAITH